MSNSVIYASLFPEWEKDELDEIINRDRLSLPWPSSIPLRERPSIVDLLKTVETRHLLAPRHSARMTRSTFKNEILSSDSLTFSPHVVARSINGPSPAPVLFVHILTHRAVLLEASAHPIIKFINSRLAILMKALKTSISKTHPELNGELTQCIEELHNAGMLMVVDDGGHQQKNDASLLRSDISGFCGMEV